MQKLWDGKCEVRNHNKEVRKRKDEYWCLEKEIFQFEDGTCDLVIYVCNVVQVYVIFILL